MEFMANISLIHEERIVVTYLLLRINTYISKWHMIPSDRRNMLCLTSAVDCSEVKLDLSSSSLLWYYNF